MEPVGSPLRTTASGVGLYVDKSRITDVSGELKPSGCFTESSPPNPCSFSTPPTGQRNGSANGLATSQHFLSEPVVGRSGSGFLVSGRVFVTAGHNLIIPTAAVPDPQNRKTHCESNFSIVFDYQRGANASTNDTILSRFSRYECRRLLRYSGSERFVPPNRSDWAVIRLDRRALYGNFLPGATEGTQRPLRLPRAAESPVTEGAALNLISHPLSLPKKLSLGVVTSVSINHVATFRASMDIWGGSSGGPVLSGQTVIGIATEGPQGSADIIDQTPGSSAKIENSIADAPVGTDDPTRTAGAVRISEVFGSRFTNPQTIANSSFVTGSGAYALTGDVNNDGTEDLVKVFAGQISTHLAPVQMTPTLPASHPDSPGAAGSLPNALTQITSDCAGGRCALGDWDGDGRADLVGVGTDGTIWSRMWQGTGFASARTTLQSGLATTLSGDPDHPAIWVKDTDEDGLPDIILYGTYPTEGDAFRYVSVSLQRIDAATGQRYFKPVRANVKLAKASVAGVNQRIFPADILGADRAWMVLTDGDGTAKQYRLGSAVFDTSPPSSSWRTLASGLPLGAGRRDFAADVTGDGRDDLVSIAADGVVRVAAAFGDNTSNTTLEDFRPWTPLGSVPCAAPAVCLPSDLSGDGRADLAVFSNDFGGTVRAFWAR